MSSSSLSRQEKYVVAVLSFIALALRIPLAFRAERELASLPYTDDAYYLFSVAQNIATGHGPSVDGIHLTNGFQPLMAVLYTPIFWLCGSDSWLAIRWSFVLNGFIAALTVYAVAVLLRALERKPNTQGLTTPIVGAAIWTFTIAIFSQMTNGLETGLSTLFLIVALILYSKLQEDSEKKLPISLWRWVGFGVLLGLAVLARIDATFFVAILVITLFIQRRSWEAIITGSIAAIVSAPWWIFNFETFGSFMPISGQAENSWPMPPWENIRRGTQAISDILSLVFYIPPISRIAWAVVLVGGLSILFYKTRLLQRIRPSYRLNVLLPFLIFSLAIIIYYISLFSAPHFLSRYFQPARILWSLIFAAGATVLWQSKARRMQGSLIAIAILGLTFSVLEYKGNYFPAIQAIDFYDTGIWAREHPNEKVAMLQSGIAGFIAPTITNLDGKVNLAALRAHQKGLLAEYLRDEHFTYIADWKPFTDDIARMAQAHELYFDSVGMVGGVQLMKLRSAQTTVK